MEPKNLVEGIDYAQFYKPYITLAPNVPLVDALAKSATLFLNYFNQLNEEQSFYSYRPNKWTLKEIVLHCIDTERIMAHRAFRFARKDTIELPGFEHNDYVAASRANQRTLQNLLEEYQQVRNATRALFATFNKEQLLRFGIANGNSVSVKALGYIIVGHELHHITICKTRYFSENQRKA